MNTVQSYSGKGFYAIPNPQTAPNAAHSAPLNYERQTDQFPLSPLASRSRTQAAKTPQQPDPLLVDNQTPVTQNPPYERHPQLRQPAMQSPFQAALLFTLHKAHGKPGRDVYVCYLKQQRVIQVERLHSLRGHNPTVNLSSVISHVRRNGDITGVIIGTWERSTSEYPYAVEFTDEVERQYHVLLEADIKLVDNLRLSETGVYSYYGEHEGPFSDAPVSHEKGICRLY